MRHLALPGLLAETRQVFDFLARELGLGLYVNVRDHYYPAGKGGREKYGKINRRVTSPEYQEALHLAQAAGFRCAARRPVGWWG